ncbi:transposase [Streptomyces justiciae]|nr:transposase [Streptomyces justiciae]MCW8382512.1 transposase [Streptomyces justiciae]
MPASCPSTASNSAPPTSPSTSRPSIARDTANRSTRVGGPVQRCPDIPSGHRSTGHATGTADRLTWTCEHCGVVHDHDVNAARNILAAGLAASACGDGVRRQRESSRTGRSSVKQEAQRATAGTPPC